MEGLWPPQGRPIREDSHKLVTDPHKSTNAGAACARKADTMSEKCKTQKERNPRRGECCTMAAAEGTITGTVNWFSVTKGYGACARA